MIRTSLFVAVVLLLAGCGAGNAGGGDAAAGPTTDPPMIPTTRLLGMRDIPDGQVVVTALTTLTAGQSASFRIAASGMTATTMPEVLMGADFGDARPLIVTTDGDGWLVTTTLPDPLPATCRILVRFTDEDGNVQETGVDDFALAMR